VSTFPMRRALAPPLRLVLTTDCNGACKFCHHEGEPAKGLMLPLSSAVSCAETAEKMRIPEIALTGGEPTIHPDFSEIISGIQNVYHGCVSLTTNGFRLSKNEISVPLHKINLSISSFDADVYGRYQNVDPVLAITEMIKFPAEHKNVNIVITEDNYLEFDSILARCLEYSIPIDAMFELRDYTEKDSDRHNHIFNLVARYGASYFELGSTVMLVAPVNDNFRVRIKHPKFSKLLNRRICSRCEKASECHERICAVRVYPDGAVSPCLNRQYRCQAGDIGERIKEAYSLLRKDGYMLSTLLG